MPVKVFTALVVVDVQNDFLENGALGVPKASEVIDPINRMAQTFERVIVTQDWHCADPFRVVCRGWRTGRRRR